MGQSGDGAGDPPLKEHIKGLDLRDERPYTCPESRSYLGEMDLAWLGESKVEEDFFRIERRREEDERARREYMFEYGPLGLAQIGS